MLSPIRIKESLSRSLVIVCLLVAAGGTAAHGGRPDRANSCENRKLRAAGDYFGCLVNAVRRVGHGTIDATIAKCDRKFERVVEQIEKAGDCAAAEGASVLGAPIKAQALETVRRIVSGIGCDTVKVVPGETVTCTFSATNATAFDLDVVLAQLAQYGVTDTDVFWLEAWGGGGSHGNTDNGGSGGAGGYAQTTSTVSAFTDTFGTSLVYYYTGLPGRFQHDSGGDGGTATYVTINDLSKTPTMSGKNVLLAGGGGGGGAGRGKAVCTIPFRFGSFKVLGGSGGAGGVAIAPTNQAGTGAGAKGGERRGRNYSGSGGTASGAGGRINGVDSSAVDGDSDFAPLGAAGGRDTNPRIGFANGVTVLTKGGGRGGQGDARLLAGGGGGGGGYGGGAGGAGAQDVHTTTNCVAGGGGGGSSFARRSAVQCNAAPQTAAPNPNGDTGFVQITFAIGGCDNASEPVSTSIDDNRD